MISSLNLDPHMYTTLVLNLSKMIQTVKQKKITKKETDESTGKPTCSAEGQSESKTEGSRFQLDEATTSWLTVPSHIQGLQGLPLVCWQRLFQGDAQAREELVRQEVRSR